MEPPLVKGRGVVVAHPPEEEGKGGVLLLLWIEEGKSVDQLRYNAHLG